MSKVVFLTLYMKDHTLDYYVLIFRGIVYEYWIQTLYAINIVLLNLNSIFNILNAKATKHRFLTNKNTKFWKLSLVIFLRFSYDFLTIFLRSFELHFLIHFFLIKKRVLRRNVAEAHNFIEEEGCRGAESLQGFKE